MSKRAIVLISFGTTYPETRRRTIDRVQKDLEATYPDWDHFEAYTSSMIRKILKRRGERVLSPREVLEYLEQNDYREVIVLPTLLLDGEEYEKIVKAVKNSNLPKLTLLPPLLYSDEDLIHFRDFLKRNLRDTYPEMTILMMGHGSKYQADEMYARLNETLESSSVENFTIACIEGKPDFGQALEYLKEKDVHQILLTPLMIVAGEHANVDLNGEKDSWRVKLESLGYEPEVLLKGLAEYPEFRKMIVEKIEN